MVAFCTSQLIATEEQAAAWNAYSSRVGEQLAQAGKGPCAVEFEGIGIIGRASDTQKKAAMKLLPSFIKELGHPQLKGEADNAEVQRGAPTKIAPTAEEKPHIEAVLKAICGVLKGAPKLWLEMPGVGKLVFPEASPRSTYAFARSSAQKPVKVMTEDSPLGEEEE